MAEVPAKTIDKIVAMHNKGSHWDEISEAVGLPQGKCMFLNEQATVSQNDRIVAKTEEDLKKKIAKAREGGMSWGVLSARSGKSEGYCRKAFEEVTGEAASGNRIGKGGRHPGGTAMKASGATKKAVAKSTGVVKKAAKKAPAKATKKVAAKKAVAKKAVAKKVAAAA